MRMLPSLGLVIGGLVLLLARDAPAQQAALPVYTDHLVNGFQDWSWGTRNLGSPSPVHSGSSSISASLAAWQGLSFWHQDFNASVYTSFTFWANGGTNGGQRFQVYVQYGTNSGTTYQLPSPIPANSWQQFVVPFSALGVVNVSNLNRITLQLTGSGTTDTFCVNDVELTAASAPAPVHLGVNAYPSSPLRRCALVRRQYRDVGRLFRHAGNDHSPSADGHADVTVHGRFGLGRIPLGHG